MSDPELEEDSLISQEDIDKLMSPASEKDEEDDAPEDDLGELSQDDIDSLMNSNVQGSGNDGETGTANGDEDELVLISPSDIDELMNSGDEADPEDAVEDSDDLGELSQEDIDSLMNFDPDEESSETDENLEMISQDDINQLIGSREKVENDNSNEGLLTQQDSTGESESGLVPDIPGSDDGWTIEESEAVEADSCEVTQETLDQLSADFDPSPDIEPIILDDETDPDESEPVETVSEMNIGELEEDSGEMDNNFDDDEDVTQEDIDALLMGDEEDEDDEELLISQDDIDTLLMAADEEDEDVLGELADNDDAGEGLEDEFDDEDFLNFDDEDDFKSEDDLDPVILRGDDKPENPEEVQKESSILTKPGWYRSKLVIASIAALVFLGIAVPISYFVFSGSDGPVEPGEAGRLAEVPVNSAQEFQEPEIEIVDVVIQQPVTKVSGNITLKDFIILAPAQAKSLNYVSLDVSIDYSDRQASQEILNNEAFFRGLIYDSIRDKLALAIDQVEVTQADIQTAVEDTLKRVIPGEAIDRISLISFKTS